MMCNFLKESMEQKEQTLTEIIECSGWDKESFNFFKVKNQLRSNFPWDALPEQIAKSLQQVASSCATSSNSLPGVAAAILSSLIGSTISVCPKPNWDEPLIFWFADIRPTGLGKTPAARMLCNFLYDEQKKADEDYSDVVNRGKRQKKDDRMTTSPRGRTYFVTDLTLEGLRSDHSGHGGKICILDELSSFVSAQNAYKQKGTDREAWLCMYDGKPARIVRVKEACTISGSRISIFGGIQPVVWKKIFGQNGRLYMHDGTICRFLITYEGDGYYPLSEVSWTDENKELWEGLLRNVTKWADRQYLENNTFKLTLSDGAREIFFNWRNDLVIAKDSFPDSVRGFIPKLVGYALRWSGVLYLMHTFHEGKEPGSILSEDDMRRGIRVCEFYLGHIIYAVQALEGPLPHVIEYTDQIVHLAKTLKSLERHVENSMLAVGFVFDKYNENCPPNLYIKSPRFLGAILRRCGLKISPGKHKANGRVGVYCLMWDSALVAFLESCPISPTNPKGEDIQDLLKKDNGMGQILQVL